MTEIPEGCVNVQKLYNTNAVVLVHSASTKMVWQK